MTETKFILNGKLELLSPLKLGSGESEHTDSDVLLDAKGKPYLPGTSLAGAVRHHLNPIEQIEKSLWSKLWGDPEKGQPSSIAIYDSELVSSNYNVTRRDGIKINHQTGLVEDKKKYDYQVLERGVQFSFRLSMSIKTDKQNETSETDFAMKLLATLISELESGKVRIGAKTNNGLGQIKLLETEIFRFDLSQANDLKRWWKKDYSNPFRVDMNHTFNLEPSRFSAKIFLELKSSLMIRSYPNLDAEHLPDDMQLHSGDSPVLPGSSLKGALRHRAVRILNTLSKDECKTENLINSLMGHVVENTDEARKGKLRVEETLLKNTVLAQQSRIKIDRFTGGTIESALFQTMPVFKLWQNPNKEYQLLEFTLEDPKDDEIGLLLLLIKDLWTGDLAVGGEKNVGRGSFSGHSAELNICGQTINLDNPLTLPANEKQILECYVQALVDHCERNAA